MSKKINIVKVVSVVIVMFLTTVNYAQEFKIENGRSSLTIFGTSNLHDWEISAKEQSGVIVFSSLEKPEISRLKVIIKAEGLKSGKSGMDKNTYKALDTKNHKNIEFNLVRVKEIKDKGNGNYAVSTEGDLTISGVTKRIDLFFNLQIKDSGVIINGTKKIKMTDYNVEPPTALFGTITTGDEVTIKLSTILTE